MARLVIAANWKMNKTPTEGVDFVNSLRPYLEQIDGVDKIVCPSFISLRSIAEALSDSEIAAGAQNMHYEASGAYTGEVSPSMIKELCEYVILGHSERRQHFGETDEMVAKKVSAALDIGLKPILCVGETLVERQSGDAQVVVQRQMRAALREVRSLQDLIVAYEPVWAIGTGVPASPTDAQKIMEFIRALMLEDYGMGAYDLPLLYGGSVNAENVGSFVTQPDVNGGLVGSASLDVEGFVALTRNAVVAYH